MKKQSRSQSLSSFRRSGRNLNRDNIRRIHQSMSTAGNVSTMEPDSAMTNGEASQLLPPGYQQSNQYQFPYTLTEDQLPFSNRRSTRIEGAYDFGRFGSYNDYQSPDHFNPTIDATVVNCQRLCKSKPTDAPIHSDAPDSGSLIDIPNNAKTAAPGYRSSCQQSYTSLSAHAKPYIPSSYADYDRTLSDQSRPVVHLSPHLVDRGSRIQFSDHARPRDKAHDTSKDLMNPATIPLTQLLRPQGGACRGLLLNAHARPKETKSCGMISNSVTTRGQSRSVRQNGRGVESHLAQSVLVHSRKTCNLPKNREPHRPRILYCNGKKVTMVDEASKVFVIDLLASETCNMIRRVTDAHLNRIKHSGDDSQGWRTLYSYTKMDLPCSEVASLPLITNRILADIVAIVGEVYGLPEAAQQLQPRSWKEPHLLLYQKVQNKP